MNARAKHRAFFAAPLLAGCIVLAGCGGTTGNVGASDAAAESGSRDDGGTADSGNSDSGSGDDAGYTACFDSQGTLSPSFKTCHADADCVIQRHESDCCGTILYVGVSASNAAAFPACETAWDSHFPGCGCASNRTGTEDGKQSTYDQDAAAPAVRCTNGTTAGQCMTYTP